MIMRVLNPPPKQGNRIPINLTDKQKEAFRQLVACQERLQWREFNIGRGPAGSLWIKELEEDGPEFNLRDFNEYVKAGLLDKMGENRYILTNLGEAAVANDFQETGTLIADLQVILKSLDANRLKLREREAEYSGAAPVGLQNEITHHQTAISLTDQILRAAAELQRQIGYLNIDPDLKARLISILGEK